MIDMIIKTIIAIFMLFLVKLTISCNLEDPWEDNYYHRF